MIPFRTPLGSLAGTTTTTLLAPVMAFMCAGLPWPSTNPSRVPAAVGNSPWQDPLVDADDLVFAAHQVGSVVWRFR
jgi:hypothetical protein